MMNKPLRILLVTQYFWPEYMRINDMVSGFVAKGHKVTVLTGIPNYPLGKVMDEYREAPEQYNNYHGADVVRVPMLSRGTSSIQLFLNFIIFCTSASIIGAFKLRKQEFDVVFTYTVSPITAAIPAVIIGKLKKIPSLIWVLDLWPETLQALNVVNKKWLLNFIGKMVSSIYNHADYVLMQSRSFLPNIKALCTRPIEDNRLIYYPSWAEDRFSDTSERESGLLDVNPDVFTILFAGNVGESQDFETMIVALEQLNNNQQKDLKPIRWVIVGDGRQSQWLEMQKQQRQLDNLILLGRHSVEAMPALFNTADCLYVALKTNEVFAKTIPGKVQSYLAAGKPILGMIDGEAAKVIRDSGAGMSCESGNVEGLVNSIDTMRNYTVDELKSMGLSGKAYYQQHFSKEILFQRLEQLFYNATKRC